MFLCCRTRPAALPLDLCLPSVSDPNATCLIIQDQPARCWSYSDSVQIGVVLNCCIPAANGCYCLRSATIVAMRRWMFCTVVLCRARANRHAVSLEHVSAVKPQHSKDCVSSRGTSGILHVGIDLAIVANML